MRDPIRSLICASFLVLSCAHSQPGSTSDREAIDRIRREIEAAENAGSIERMRPHATDDLVLMAPNFPAIKGADNALNAMRDLFSAFTVQIQYTSEEIVVDGDLGFDRGTYRQTLTPRQGGPAMTETGKYLLVSQRGADGKWRHSRVIWNVSDPLPQSR